MEEEIHKQLAELQNQLYKLKSAVEYIDQAKTVIESSDKLVKSFSEIHVEYDSLKKVTQTLIDNIDNVDFPKRQILYVIRLRPLISVSVISKQG